MKHLELLRLKTGYPLKSSLCSIRILKIPIWTSPAKRSIFLQQMKRTMNPIESRYGWLHSDLPGRPAETLNNWIPLTPLSEMAQQEYDVLIIGTGAGGGSVLWRFCEQWKKQKKRIGIIERGDQVIPTHARNLSTMNQERLTAYFSYLSKPLPGALPEYPGARQLFALGGRTLFWYAFTPRLHAWDLAKWPIPVHEMESYYGIAEQVMNVTEHLRKELRSRKFYWSGYGCAVIPKRHLFQLRLISYPNLSDRFIPTCLRVPFPCLPEL